jgi:hypothetical protein
MKKSILIGLFLSVAFIATAQNSIKIADITGEYCEFSTLAKPFSTKEIAVVFSNNEMQRLADSEGKDMVSTTGYPVFFLNAFAEKGWEVVSVYDSKRGDFMMHIYLLRRKK